MRIPALFILLMAVVPSAGCATDPPRFLVAEPCPAADGVYYKLDAVCNDARLRHLAELKTGQHIADILLGTPTGKNGIGYYAHALAAQIGPQGRVFAITRTEMAANASDGTIGGRVITGDFADTNVEKITMPLDKLPTLPRLDLIWAASTGYSFFAFMPPLDPQRFKPLHDALKPGGLFILMDADVEQFCMGGPKDGCKSGHPYWIADLPRRQVQQIIEQAGFTLELDTGDLRDVKPRNPDRLVGVWGSSMNIGSSGRPFIWKFRRLPG